MQQVLELASRVAAVDSTVLISGESGVGKERLARWLHESSPRGSGPFVAVNCGAFSDTLLESELFGHARGAFTGAIADRAGVFEAAHGGTLFLDEVGEMSPAMQTRLLRVVQDREIRRLGENRGRCVNARLVAATNRNLADDVAQNRFRADLWYRLRVVELHIPPLRERPEELHALAIDLLRHTAAKLGRSVSEFTPSALDRIATYAWPGNVRELEHAIEHACIVTRSTRIDLDDLPAAVHDERPPHDLLAERERQFIRSVVERHHGRRRLAAAELGISVSTLNRRLRAATSQVPR